MKKNNLYDYLFICFVILITTFRLFYIKSFNLHPDEAYYWEWSRHLDLSYYDHPPMVAYIIFIFTKIFGDTEFGVRIGAILLSFFATIFLYLFIKELFSSEKFAFLSSFLLNFTLIFAVGSIIITPDTPLIFFWIVSLYFLYKTIFKDNKIFYILGIFLGLGLLSKYTMIFFIPCLFLFLISYKKYRIYFFKKELYLCIIISFLFFIPVIFWNLKQGFSSFLFQLHHGLQTKEISHFYSFYNFILGQIGVITPFVFIGVLLSFYFNIFHGIKEKNEKYIYLFCFSFPIFLIFTIISFFSKIEANWLAFAYIPCIMSIPFILAQNKIKKIFLAIIFLTSFSFTLICHYPFLIKLPQDVINRTNDLYGWENLGMEINKIKQNKKENTFVFSLHHQITAEISFYTKSNAYLINPLGRKTQYDYWQKPSSGWNAICVVEDKKEIENVASFFKKVKMIKKLNIYRKEYKKPIRNFYIYECYLYK